MARDRDRAQQIGEKGGGRGEQADHERRLAGVVVGDCGSDGGDAAGDRFGVEERLADHDARFSREKTRSTSRRVKSFRLTQGWCERNNRTLRFLRLLRTGFATVTSM